MARSRITIQFRRQAPNSYLARPSGRRFVPPITP
jgi:hypothetical protein